MLESWNDQNDSAFILVCDNDLQLKTFSPVFPIDRPSFGVKTNSYLYGNHSFDSIGRQFTLRQLDYDHNFKTKYSIINGYYNHIMDINTEGNLVKLLIDSYDSSYKVDFPSIHFLDSNLVLRRLCSYSLKSKEIISFEYLRVCDDGGFLINPHKYSDGSLQRSILKTDSLGLVYNTDIVCECEDFNTGIESKEKSELHIAVFPNPASERVVVQLPHDQKAEIALRNTNGQVIIKQLTRIQRNELDVSALPRGIYLLEVKTEDLVGMRKIVVE